MIPKLMIAHAEINNSDLIVLSTADSTLLTLDQVISTYYQTYNEIHFLKSILDCHGIYVLIEK